MNISKEGREKDMNLDAPVPKRQKTGRKGPFNDSRNVVLLLNLLEEDSGYTLKELTSKMAEFNVITSTAAIAR